MLRKLQDANLEGKKILLRVDFNVEFEDGNPKEIYKIKAAKESIDFILKSKGVKLALLSHMGRPDGKEDEFSFKDNIREIGKILGINLFFAEDCIGESVSGELAELKDGQVLMLENVRFYKEEKEGDEEFAKKLAGNFDVYVNDAFSNSHRGHASMVGVTKYLPSYAGISLQKEIKELEKARSNVERPAVAIIGGAKIETKLPIVEFFSKNYDYVLVGGRLGIEAEEQSVAFPENVMIPKDYTGDGLDIGPETIKNFEQYIEEANYILWNGPLGKFEEPEFAKGTQAVLAYVLRNSNAYKIAGGGETVQVIESAAATQKFDFISTGGGAMLEYILGEELPGIKVLE